MNAILAILQWFWALVLRAIRGIVADTPHANLFPDAQETPNSPDDADTIPRIPVMSDANAEPETDAKPEVKYTTDLSDDFFTGLAQMGKQQGWDPALLLQVMSHESGIKANAYNASGPAYGLIQFFGKGYSYVRNLNAAQQVPLIAAYYHPHAPYANAGQVYGQNFLPQRMVDRGRDPSTVLTVAGESYYEQNVRRDKDGNLIGGLDFNRDGKITIEDLQNVAEHAAQSLGARYSEAYARLRYAQSQLGVSVSGRVGSTVSIIALWVVSAAALYWWRKNL